MEFKRETWLHRTSLDGKYTIILDRWSNTYTIKDNTKNEIIKYPTGYDMVFQSLRSAKEFLESL